MYKSPVHLSDIKKSLLSIWPNDDEFKSSFKDKTLTTPRIIKYLLAKLETSIVGDNSLVPNSEALTVEHILPKRPSSKWPQTMRKEDHLREYLNKIGNLTILTEPMNRGCESREFVFKKNIYKESKFKMTQELSSLNEWTQDEIQNRQSSLADIAAKTWTI